MDNTQPKTILKHRAHKMRISDPTNAQVEFFRKCVGTKDGNVGYPFARQTWMNLVD